VGVIELEDIFEEEQKILDDALIYSAEIKNEAIPFDKERYHALVKEYRRLLKQLRRITKLSDRTTVTLNESKHDLLDKVHFDPLTGIYNRRFMEDNIKRIIRSLARSKGCLSVLMVDIDYFKRYNDTYGHSEGDECLKAVAEAIKNSLSRADDFVVRYGGEEFAVILPDTDEIGGRYIAGEILENVRACDIPHEKNDAAPCITVSVGGTSSEVGNTQTGGEYIKRADTALYQSKQNGRNRYTFIDFKEDP